MVYDVGEKRVSKALKVGRRYLSWVQNSVFECLVDPQQWAKLRHELLAIFEADKDSLRFYFLGAHWKNRVEHQGAKPAYDPEGTLIL